MDFKISQKLVGTFNVVFTRFKFYFVEIATSKTKLNCYAYNKIFFNDITEVAFNILRKIPN